MWSKALKGILPSAAGVVIILLLLLLPTGFEGAFNGKGMIRCRGTILSVDDSKIVDSGLIRSGEQTCEIRLDSGTFKGEITQGINMLTGSMENDKIFKVGDKVLAAVSHSNEKIISVSLIDHYRIFKEAALALIFAAFLILFAGKTGVRAILSFVITVLTIWKVLIPCMLKGIHPVTAGLFITVFLTVVIITLVYGFDRRSLAASSGAILGVITTVILGIIFTDLFQIHGAIMAHSESLLYSGFEHLNLTNIFIASIFIGSSGAVMDLAVDITSSVHEVIGKRPDIGWKEAAMCGIRVGRAAMGTMTTTLLLAYSGGYVALLMVFMAQGTPIVNILNYKYVSAEILDTIVGSFGLVTVAPFTAVTSAILLTRRGSSAETD